MVIQRDVATALATSGAPGPAFTWGQGGRRMTPDDIARQRALAARQMQTDYSPLQHWTQGLARVSENLLGGLNARQANLAADRNVAESKDVASALMLPPDDAPMPSSAPAAPAMAPAMAPEMPMQTDGAPPISAAPPPPTDWQETLGTDTAAQMLTAGPPAESAETRIASALTAPTPQASLPRATGPREAIIAALTNPYVSDQVRAVADTMWKQEYEASKPQYFMSGQDRVVVDPVTGQTQVLYDAPEDFEIYAERLGLEPGTDEYSDAAADYVLRSAGPTAQAGRQFLEGVRQDNRKELEGVRQGNRLQLRTTPTYLQANPRATGGGGGGGRPTSMAGVVAPILAKVAGGKPLTAGEQQALDTYYRRKGGGGGRTPTTGSGERVIVNKQGQKMVVRNGKWVPLK